MANKCNTALVDPPRAITTVIAFSNAFFVIIIFGVIFFLIRVTICSPAFLHSSFFSGYTAGVDEDCGKLIPKDSIAEDIVLAVYIPPHAPGPGHALHSIHLNSSLEIFPALYFPTASKMDTIST